MNNENDDIDFTQNSLQKRASRRTYLITCSQVNRVVFPTRESFGNCVAECFDSGSGKVKVEHWACCLEHHQDGGEHYHMSVKLSGPKRWLSIKNQIFENHGAVLHFSESHDNYYTAYKYICKTDVDVFKSFNHPNLDNIGSPKTKTCIKSYRNKHKLVNEQNKTNCTEQNNEIQQNKKQKLKLTRLTNLDVAEFMISNNIQNTKELFAIANDRKLEGNKDLAGFVLSRSTKSLSELIENSWHMENAKTELVRAQTPRMDVLKEAYNKECMEGCGGMWLQCATEVLNNNHIHPFVFAAALRDLLTKGRGKFRNLMIVGPANCGKTFMLSPLQNMYNTFSNPANDKYAWLGVENCEIIFLNDFRWNSEMIAWKELLLLLEGQPVHLPSPKNHYACDISITTDVPIFATGKACISYVGRFNSTDERENEMMAVRWKVFDFTHRIAEKDQKTVPPCSKCFAELVLSGQV